jgi:6-phosphogluconolactonase/glucosamine-6-phosphate isomerase/deaminase
MGSGKSEVVDQVMSGADIDLPAARIAAYNGETEWYLDQAAYGLR